ncbi:MAG: carbohydrate ABC transporter permease [Chloroflexi bacterium]|nr:carbohydrate ABC transporter permease [Chloroflexota bacterium]
MKKKTTWFYRLQSIFGRVVIHLVLLVGVVIVVFPFYWMVTTSFKTLDEAVQFPPTLLPKVWMFSNWIEAWNSAPFGRYFFNSIFVSTSVTFLVLTTSVLAAYTFARIRLPGKDLIFVLFLATMMIPFEVILIPDFVIVKKLGWYNTYAALILPWSAQVFSIFLMRQFFLSVPLDLYEAAQVDGCTHHRFLWHIALPLSVPALLTCGIFSFLGSWNALLWPLITTSSSEMRPLQVGLAVFLTEEGIYYQLLMAAATFTVLPIIIIYFFAQRQFIEGIARTGIKG